MKLTKGVNLTGAQRLEVLRVFSNRFTGEHKPTWTNRDDCKHCVPTAAIDAQWIDEHAFYIKKDGSIATVPGRAEPAHLGD